MNYLLVGHSSFYVREGWIQKGIKYIKNNNKDNAFSKSNIKAIDELGIGSVMVLSLKFWLTSLDLIKKEKKTYITKRWIDLILEKDPYFQNNNTLWLLHSYIMERDNEDEVLLLWKLILQSKKLNNFDYAKIKNQVEIFLKEHELKFSEKSIKDSINVFIKMYYQEKEEKLDPENNMYSPFIRLNYLEKNISGEYRFRNIMAKEISEYIVYFLLNRNFLKNKNRQIAVKDAYEKFNGIIRMRHYEYEKLLVKLENKEYISVDRGGGLANIILKKEISEKEIITRILESE
ncbi:MAG: DUF4007 family protein [Fusobacterium sp. JB019]|nr:DUF4007 family protein [Fusobacterium sp. JB019]